MSIPTKGSRRIRVGGREYRWFVRKKPTYSQGAFESPMRLAIQACATGHTCVLIVNLRISRPDNWIGPHQTGLTPSVVADIIEHALVAGWDPSASSSRFALEYPMIRDSIGHVSRS